MITFKELFFFLINSIQVAIVKYLKEPEFISF